MENMNNGYAFGWDSEIENDGPEFILLPDGDYDFVVEKFERGRYEGGDKIPACPKATLYLRFETAEGETIIKKDLLLHSKVEGILCAFFTCIGQRKHGQRVSMNWAAVPGARGRARIGKRLYNGNTYNDVKRFLEPPETTYAVPTQQYQQSTYMPSQQSYPAQGGYTTGKF